MKPYIIGGGWMDVSNSGEKYLRISFKDAVMPKVTCTMFKNKKKSKDNSPDYLIYALGSNDPEPGKDDLF